MLLEPRKVNTLKKGLQHTSCSLALRYKREIFLDSRFAFKPLLVLWWFKARLYFPTFVLHWSRSVSLFTAVLPPVPTLSSKSKYREHHRECPYFFFPDRKGSFDNKTHSPWMGGCEESDLTFLILPIMPHYRRAELSEGQTWISHHHTYLESFKK